MKKWMLAALLVAAGAAQASEISVTYSESTSGLDLAGAFSGVDANHDGLLTFGELDSWTINYGGGATLPALNDIGTFDYVHNVWTPDALQWDRTTHDAYMTWNDFGYSANTSNFNWQFATQVTSAVPEPASTAMLCVGLLAIGVKARKRRA